jgi:dimethylamine monooxygenase subunit A
MHTPFDGYSKPFTIGLSQIDEREWIEVDDRLLVYLNEKDRLFSTQLETVFATNSDTEAAQNELLALLITHLCTYFPKVYQCNGTYMQVLGKRIDLKSTPSLITAASLIAEDIALMRKSDEGWRLVAGAICFPSSWSIKDKIGHPLHKVHDPVPDFNEGTRNALLIDRMFDNIQPDRLVLRWNYSLYGDRVLHHPHISEDPRFQEDIFVRTERQTLRKLPKSGDIVFTIGIHLTPLSDIGQQANKDRLISSLITEIEGLTPAQRIYKGLSPERKALLARLRSL